MVFVTVDPHRDTPPVIAQYLSRIDPGFIGLTGSTRTIEQVAASMGVVVEGIDEHHEGAYDVTHSSQVIGFDAARRGIVVWTEGTRSAPTGPTSSAWFDNRVDAGIRMGA